MPCQRPPDILTAQRSGKIGIILVFRMGAMRGTTPAASRSCDLGIRIISLLQSRNQPRRSRWRAKSRPHRSPRRDDSSTQSVMVDLSPRRAHAWRRRPSTRPISINHNGCGPRSAAQQDDAECAGRRERRSSESTHAFMNPRSVARPKGRRPYRAAVNVRRGSCRHWHRCGTPHRRMPVYRAASARKSRRGAPQGSARRARIRTLPSSSAGGPTSSATGPPA